jgi:hypothetical protein
MGDVLARLIDLAGEAAIQQPDVDAARAKHEFDDAIARLRAEEASACPR